MESNNLPIPPWGLGPVGSGVKPDLWQARMLANSQRKAYFTFFCDKCASNSWHSVATGRCGNCHPTPGVSRRQARAARNMTYLGDCRNCGPSAHWTRNGKCTVCFTAQNRERSRPGYTAPCDARDQAKASGSTTYTALCKLHGEQAHHTRRGVCLACYDTLGAPRDDLYVRWCKRCRARTVYAKATRCCIECEPGL